MSGLITVGVDPAPVQTALTVWDGQQERILHKMLRPNDEVRKFILRELNQFRPTLVAIETIQSMGARVGATVFETAFFVGELPVLLAHTDPKQIVRVTRTRIKKHHTGDIRTKDKDVREALVKRFGEPGSKSAPGILYGVANDMWSSTAIAVWAYDIATQGVPRLQKKTAKKRAKKREKTCKELPLL